MGLMCFDGFYQRGMATVRRMGGSRSENGKEGGKRGDGRDIRFLDRRIVASGSEEMTVVWEEKIWIGGGGKIWIGALGAIGSGMQVCDQEICRGWRT